jgi:hypothetical protein
MEVCPFVDEETNGSYLFENRLNGLALMAESNIKV